MAVYFTQADVQRRMPLELLLDIYVFDGEQRSLTSAVTNRLADDILDVESIIDQTLVKVYGQDKLSVIQALSPTPRALRRIGVDLFVARAFQIQPQFIRSEWEARSDRALKDLKELRLRDVQLDVTGAPEPGVNEGVELLLVTDEVERQDDDVPMMWDDMGDFL